MIFPLVGNDKIKLSVNNFIAERRIPHAILIEGELGTGKHTLAKFLTNAIVCGEANPPCGECNNCKKAISNSHPDITYIAPEEDKKNISVSQIRQARADAFIKPHEALRRVFVIDGADTLNEQSQNALLKVLEEPPKSVMFILITTSKASLLETIISRCVILTLNEPEFSVGFNYIKENSSFSDAEIKNALEICKNNIGRAVNLLGGRENSKTEVKAKEFFECLLNGDQLGMLKAVAVFEKSRPEADRFIKDLKYLIANKIRQQPNGYNSKALMNFYNEIPSFEQSLLTNINLNLLFCSLVCKATQLLWRNK